MDRLEWLSQDGDSESQVGDVSDTDGTVERIADLATNIAEDVIFMVRGTTVRHGGGIETAEEAP